MNEHRGPPNETCLQSLIPDYPVILEEENGNIALGNEVNSVAPGQNKHPVSLMTDKQCEELAFPVLFPKGMYGYTYEREIKLTPVIYFNARLLHFSGRFATNAEQFVIEQKKVSDSINIALRKIHERTMKASHLKSNDAQGLIKDLNSKGQAFFSETNFWISTTLATFYV